MNLSSRLDEARKKREAGLAPEVGHDKFDLRFQVEGEQVYEGQELRTGDELTPDTWDAIRNRRDGNDLPRWNPKRANPETTALPDDDLIDLRPTPPELDLPAHEAEEGFAMPAWAPEGTDVYQAPSEHEGHHPKESCPNCGAEARVEVVDLLGGKARLGCDRCGASWETQTARRRSRPGLL
jgi:hypothetical protein